MVRVGLVIEYYALTVSVTTATMSIPNVGNVTTVVFLDGVSASVKHECLPALLKCNTPCKSPDHK